MLGSSKGRRHKAVRSLLPGHGALRSYITFLSNLSRLSSLSTNLTPSQTLYMTFNYLQDSIHDLKYI